MAGQSLYGLLAKLPHRPTPASASKPWSTSTKTARLPGLSRPGRGSMVASVAKAAVHKPTLLNAIHNAGPLAPIQLRLNYISAQLANLLVTLPMPAQMLNVQVLVDRLNASKLSKKRARRPAWLLHLQFSLVCPRLRDLHAHLCARQYLIGSGRGGAYRHREALRRV